MKSYRSLQILHGIFAQCFCGWLIPLQMLIVNWIGILGIFGAIKLSPPKSIRMGMGAYSSLVYLVVLMRKFGVTYDQSKDTVLSWFHFRGLNIVMRKFVRSFKPISMHSGMFFKFRMSTVAVMGRFVIDFTITLLLYYYKISMSFPKK